MLIPARTILSHLPPSRAASSASISRTAGTISLSLSACSSSISAKSRSSKRQTTGGGCRERRRTGGEVPGERPSGRKGGLRRGCERGNRGRGRASRRSGWRCRRGHEDHGVTRCGFLGEGGRGARGAEGFTVRGIVTALGSDEKDGRWVFGALCSGQEMKGEVSVALSWGKVHYSAWRWHLVG